MSREQLYFAYGSNLNEDDLRKWCRREMHEYPLVKERGADFLPDQEVVFNHKSTQRNGGVLNLRPVVGHAVPGILFEVAPGGWEVLDRKEGAPRAYRQEPVVVLSSSGQEVEAIAYVVPEDRVTTPFVEPHADYVNVVREGLRRHALPTSALEDAAAAREPASLAAGLFVYGTLLRGEARHHLLASGGATEGVERGKTLGTLFDLGDYPALVTGDDGVVEGEFVPLARAEELLKALDVVEGFMGWGERTSLFRRSIVRVTTDDGRLMLAWAYVFNGVPRGPVIESGRWRERRRAGASLPSRAER